jgi:hypothetical protein
VLTRRAEGIFAPGVASIKRTNKARSAGAAIEQAMLTKRIKFDALC